MSFHEAGSLALQAWVKEAEAYLLELMGSASASSQSIKAPEETVEEGAAAQ